MIICPVGLPFTLDTAEGYLSKTEVTRNLTLLP